MTFRFLSRHATIMFLGAILLSACSSSEDDVSPGDARFSDASLADETPFVSDALESGRQQDHAVTDAEVRETGEEQDVSTDVVEVEATPEADVAHDSSADSVVPPEVTIGVLTGPKQLDVKATDKKYRTLQGGGSDGTYGYFVMMYKEAKGTEVFHYTQLIKYRISDGTRIATANFDVINNKTNQLGHGNDVAFNHDTGKLIIPAWTNDSSTQPSDNQKTVRIIDPETLKIVDTKKLDVNLTNLCYAKGTYLTFASGNFRTYDADFKPISAIAFDIGEIEKKHAPNGTEGVGQGIDCDADYVYITRWYPKTKSNVVYVADWKAQLVGVYSYNELNNKGTESENLMHISGSRMLYGFNLSTVGGEVWRIDKLMYEVKYEPNGGSGSMANTRVLYGRNTPLRKNAFVLVGKQFAGWAARRSSDDKWRYRKPDGSEDGWYAKGAQPSGWTYYNYKDEAIVLKSAPWGLVTMHAQWK